MFKETDSGDHLLALTPFYASLFQANCPSLMDKSEHGFGTTKSGKNKRAFFSGLSVREIQQIRNFIEYYKTCIVIGRNRHISPYFSNEVDFCLALDYNRSEPAARQRTEVGELEYKAKYHHDRDCCARLAEMLATALRRVPVPVFARPRRIAYVPTDPKRDFYLPWNLTESIVKGVPDSFWGHEQPRLKSSLRLNKVSAKNLTVEQKVAQWNEVLDARGVELSGDVSGQSICIVDDLYQSGASLWSFARHLKEIGAEHVVGLVCVKSLRDTDNQ